MFKISSCLVCDSYEKQLMHSRGGEAPVFHILDSAVTISEFINSWEDRVSPCTDCMTLACSEVLFSVCVCLVSWQLLELNEDMNYLRYAQPLLFVCECLLKLMNAPASAKLRKSVEGRSTSGPAIIEWDIKSSRILGCIQIITSNTPCLFVKFHKLPNPRPGTGSWLWRCDRVR